MGWAPLGEGSLWCESLGVQLSVCASESISGYVHAMPRHVCTIECILRSLGTFAGGACAPPSGYVGVCRRCAQCPFPGPRTGHDWESGTRGVLGWRGWKVPERRW